MSQRHHIEVDSDTLESVAFNHSIPIERSTDEQRMYVVLDNITFFAPSPNEVTC